MKPANLPKAIVLITGVVHIGMQLALAEVPDTCQGQPVTIKGSDFDDAK
jgi:hypothetical protein